MSSLEGDYVKVFQCRTTFERELVRRGLLNLLKATAADVEAVRLEKRISDVMQKLNSHTLDAGTEQRLLQELGGRVLATAKRVGKARFAQVAARHVGKAKALPKYIEEAVTWILEQ